MILQVLDIILEIILKKLLNISEKKTVVYKLSIKSNFVHDQILLFMMEQLSSKIIMNSFLKGSL